MSSIPQFPNRQGITAQWALKPPKRFGRKEGLEFQATFTNPNNKALTSVFLLEIGGKESPFKNDVQIATKEVTVGPNGEKTVSFRFPRGIRGPDGSLLKPGTYRISLFKGRKPNATLQETAEVTVTNKPPNKNEVPDQQEPTLQQRLTDAVSDLPEPFDDPRVASATAVGGLALLLLVTTGNSRSPVQPIRRFRTRR